MTLALLIFGLALAMLVHELGHLAAARLCGVRASELSLGLGPRLGGMKLGDFRFSLRALPLGSFVRLDGKALGDASLPRQLCVHLGGVGLNVLAAALAYGTIFGWLNLLMAVGNLLPLYQHDGWKCGVALLRALLRRQSRPAEWAFTLSGGMSTLALAYVLLRFVL